MKIAIVGSRTLSVDIAPYLPTDITEIITGGAKGIDGLAEAYADKYKISKHILRPNYQKYRCNAPLMRNREIVEHCDMLLAFWDGRSKGTAFTIQFAQEHGK